MSGRRSVSGAAGLAVIKPSQTASQQLQTTTIRDVAVSMGVPRLYGVVAAFTVAVPGCWAPASAQKVSAHGDTSIVAAPGVTVRLEQTRSRVLYLEQKGGMVTPVAPPIPANVHEPAPPIVADPKARSAVAPARKSARKSAT